MFDGYGIASVKDHEHMRRSSRMKSKEILFTNDMKVVVKREDFLSNSKNKSLLISSLKPSFEQDNQKVTLSRADADTDIVKIALQVLFVNVYFLSYNFM